MGLDMVFEDRGTRTFPRLPSCDKEFIDMFIAPLTVSYSCLGALVSCGVPPEKVKSDLEPWMSICRAIYKMLVTLCGLRRHRPFPTELLEPFLFHAGRALRAAGYPLGRAVAFARLLAWASGGNPDRAETLIVGAYDDSRSSELLQKQQNLAKYRGARDVVADALTQHAPYRSNDWALDASLIVIIKTSEVLGAPLDSKAIGEIVVYGHESYKYYHKYYVNDPLRGILAYEAKSRRGELVFEPKTISRYYIDSVTMYIDQFGGTIPTYKVEFRDSKDPTAPPLSPPRDTNITELTKFLRKAEGRPYSTSLRDALSALIGGFIRYKLAKTEPKSSTQLPHF